MSCWRDERERERMSHFEKPLSCSTVWSIDRMIDVFIEVIDNDSTKICDVHDVKKEKLKTRMRWMVCELYVSRVLRRGVSVGGTGTAKRLTIDKWREINGDVSIWGDFWQEYFLIGFAFNGDIWKCTRMEKLLFEIHSKSIGDCISDIAMTVDYVFVYFLDRIDSQVFTTSYYSRPANSLLQNSPLKVYICTFDRERRLLEISSNAHLPNISATLSRNVTQNIPSSFRISGDVFIT